MSSEDWNDIGHEHTRGGDDEDRSVQENTSLVSQYPRCLEPLASSYIVRVHLINGDYRSIRISAKTTAAELCGMMTKKLGIKSAKKMSNFFGLFRSDEKWNVSYYASIPRQKSVVQALRNWDQRDMLVFQIYLFVDKEIMVSRDRIIEKMLYYQSVYHILIGYYFCNLEEALWFGGMIAQSRYGNFDPSVHDPTFYLRDELRDYVPQVYLPANDAEQSVKGDAIRAKKMLALGKRVSWTHERMRGTNRYDAERKFLRRCRAYPIFGCTVFKTSVEMHTKKLLKLKWSKNVLLGICVSGIKIFTQKSARKSQKFVHRFLFQDIGRWGFTQSGDFFVEAIFHDGKRSPKKKNLRRPEYLVFGTQKGKAIAALLTAYVEGLSKEQVTPQLGRSRRSSRSISLGSGENFEKKDTKYERAMRSVTFIQSVFRGYRVRRIMYQWAAAMQIQSVWRSYRARKAIGRMVQHMRLVLQKNGVSLSDAKYAHGIS